MIDDEDIANGVLIETPATPNAVLTWAIDTAGGTGEEGEWNVYFPDDGQTQDCAQVWAEREQEHPENEPLVGFWVSDLGVEWRCEFAPSEARHLAAALIAAASAAEDQAALLREDGDA